MFNFLGKAWPFRVGMGGAYDAIDSSKTRRRRPTHAGLSEDNILDDAKRRKLIGTTQDIQRNFAIVAWAVRQHLNYVSSFTFQCRTGNESLDKAVERYMKRWGKKENCDVRRQHPFRRIIRLSEAGRVVHGDVGLLKLAGIRNNTRGKLQAIEGDRIRTPDRNELKEGDRWVNGVKLSELGAPIAYGIHKRARKWGDYEYLRTVNASSLFVHGNYERFDQVRGVSPIASALNSFQDVYEGFDYALAKVKVAQLFGLAIFRDATTGFDGADAVYNDSEETDLEGYEIDFAGGPQLLDLNPGDRAEFLESRTPAPETIALLKLVLHVSLKALDLPYSFFDEAHTNFFGSRASLINYLHGCAHRIRDLQELLDEITQWRLTMAVIDGEIQLPAGMSVDDLNWEWVPAGVPWWDPLKEVKGHVMAIEKGLDNPQRVCRMAGTDFYENVDEIAKAQEYAAAKGVNLSLVLGQGSNEQNENSTDESADVAEQL